MQSLSLPGDEVEPVALRQPKWEAQVAPQNAAEDRIVSDFTDQLETLDKQKGSNLTQLFKDRCLGGVFTLSPA